MGSSKAGWGDGPWQTEPDREIWQDEASGYTCVAVRMTGGMGHWCGYVAVPEGHIAYGQGYDDVAAEVHGGLTYAEAHCPGEKPDGRWWLGFDCAHGGDLMPGMHATFRKACIPGISDLGSGDTYRTLAYVKAECTELARQLLPLPDAISGAPAP